MRIPRHPEALWNNIVACIIISLVLSACGGSSSESTNENLKVSSIGDGMSYALAAGTNSDTLNPQVVSVTKISEVRISRTVFDYVFKVVIQNGSQQINSFSATLFEVGSGSAIIDGSVVVASLGPGSRITAADTITIRHDRTFAFDANALKWQISGWPVAKLRGKLVDAPIAGLAYATGTVSGKTDENGFFNYTYPGEEVRFSVGSFNIGHGQAADYIHIYDLAANQDQQGVGRNLRLAQLFQSLDQNRGAAAVIKLPNNLTAEIINSAPLELEGAQIDFENSLKRLLNRLLIDDQFVSISAAKAKADSYIAEVLSKCPLSIPASPDGISAPFRIVTGNLTCNDIARINYYRARIEPMLSAQANAAVDQTAVVESAFSKEVASAAIDANPVLAAFQTIDSVVDGVESAQRGGAITQVTSLAKIFLSSAQLATKTFAAFDDNSGTANGDAESARLNSVVVSKMLDVISNGASCRAFFSGETGDDSSACLKTIADSISLLQKSYELPQFRIKSEVDQRLLAAELKVAADIASGGAAILKTISKLPDGGDKLRRAAFGLAESVVKVGRDSITLFYANRKQPVPNTGGVAVFAGILDYAALPILSLAKNCYAAKTLNPTDLTKCVTSQAREVISVGIEGGIAVFGTYNTIRTVGELNEAITARLIIEELLWAGQANANSVYEKYSVPISAFGTSNFFGLVKAIGEKKGDFNGLTTYLEWDSLVWAAVWKGQNSFNVPSTMELVRSYLALIYQNTTPNFATPVLTILPAANGEGVIDVQLKISPEESGFVSGTVVCSSAGSTNYPPAHPWSAQLSGITTLSFSILYETAGLKGIACSLYTGSRLFVGSKTVAALPVVPTVDSITPIFAISGRATKFTVIGRDLPLTALLSLSGARESCNAPIDNTLSGFTVTCTPGAPGSATAVVARESGGSQLKSIAIAIASQTLGVVVSSPSNPTAFETVTIWIIDAYETVKSVVWNFGEGIATVVAKVASGVSEVLSYIFTSAGDKTITVTYKDADAGLGNTIGTSAVTLSVSSSSGVSATATITSIKTAAGVDISDQGTTSETRLTLSGTLSGPISNYFSVWVYLDDARLAQATVDGTSWTYTAASDISAGTHKFAVAVVRFDSVEGAKSASRSLTILGSSTDIGLIAHYPFDGSLADRIRPGAMGLLLPQRTSPIFESSAFGQAVQLTPPSALAGSYLRGTALVSTDTSFTIAATVKPNGIAANGVNALIFQRTDLGGEAPGCSGNAYNFGLMIYAGRWLFMVSTLQDGNCVHANIYGQEAPVAGRYYKVAGVYDKAARKARLYIDGALVGEQAAGSSFRITPNMVTTIGNQPWASPAQPANASIDDLKVYSRALAPAELPKDQWDAFLDYSLDANPSGPWRYSFETAGQGIRPMAAAGANCGDQGMSCWKPSADSAGLPMVAINSTGAVHRNRTLVIPPNMLVLHPGLVGERAVVEFVAPADGRYKFTGRWEIVDKNPSGVKLTWVGPRDTGATTLLNGYTATSPISVMATLAAGEKVSFSVDANGNYGNDSTGLVLQVTNQGPADPALVGYWSFDDCTAADNSGNGGTGQLVGSPVCAQGVAGSGMKLNATNWIDIPSRTSLEFTTSFTISAWFKAEALTDERSVRLVDKTAAGVNDGYLLSVWASGLSLIGGGPFGVVSNPISITNNVYHHAVVTFGNGIASFYLDGVPIGSRPVGAISMFVNPNRGLRIGASQGADAHPTLNNFVGIIDEVRLYNTALSSSDVFGLYQATSKTGAGSGSITVLANTIPGAVLTVPAGVSSCAFTSTGTWSAGPNAPPEYQNADGVIGTNTLNLTDFGVPIPSAPIMALVVQHSSSGKWDLLGASKTISVQAGETLSFMMNDATTFGYTDGNTGQLSTVWTCN